MTKHFIKPLRDRKILPEAQISEIFSNIESIIPAHEIIALKLEETDSVRLCCLSLSLSLGDDGNWC